MTNREAMERAMDMIVSHGQVEVNKSGTKAKAAPTADDELTKGGAEADAEAWNMLRHLSRIL